MARLYVPLDVNFATDDKILAAGPTAAYVYVCSLAFAKRTMSDGLIKRGQLAVVAPGVTGNIRRHAMKLVDVGLWAEVDEGWLIAAWSKRNLTADAVRSRAQQKRERAQKANHERWHINGRRSDDCPYCDPHNDPQTIPDGLQQGPLEDPKRNSIEKRIPSDPNKDDTEHTLDRPTLAAAARATRATLHTQ